MRALLLVSLLVGCADTTPPTWSSDGEFEVVEIGTHEASVRWPTANDDREVVFYRLRNEGALITDVGASVNQEDITQLDEATTVRISVEALDDAGNASEPLYVEVTTRDGSPPTWPTGATLTARTDGEGDAAQLVVSWTAADDNVAVARYAILRGGDTLGDVDANTSTLTTTGDEQGIRIMATDEAGNRSRDLAVTAPSEPSEPGEQALVAGADVAPVAPVPHRERVQLSPAALRSIQSSISRMPLNQRLQIAPGVTAMLPR